VGNALETSGETTAVIFCLTRGYSGFNKMRYLKLILRNLLIRRAIKGSAEKYDSVIFHEGNIGLIDQVILRIFSLDLRLRFVEVDDYFEGLSPARTPKLGGASLGYVMMCRFQYGKVWTYLANYEILIRIDDDCFVSKIPSLLIDQLFACSGIGEETHLETNQTMPIYLKDQNLGDLYDQKFPYTNLYATRGSFWKRTDVQSFLQGVLNKQDSIENRWGDLPVIGVALKAFGAWDYNLNILKDFRYEHFSHRASVETGSISFGEMGTLRMVLGGFKKLFKSS
jgi:hypothetical protein